MCSGEEYLSDPFQILWTYGTHPTNDSSIEFKIWLWLADKFQITVPGILNSTETSQFDV